LGDIVHWVSHDDDIKKGTYGVVLEFKGGKAVCKFEGETRRLSL